MPNKGSRGQWLRHAGRRTRLSTQTLANLQLQFFVTRAAPG